MVVAVRFKGAVGVPAPPVVATTVFVQNPGPIAFHARTRYRRTAPAEAVSSRYTRTAVFVPKIQAPPFTDTWIS